MIGSESKSIFKIMWTPAVDGLIWNAAPETEVPANAPLYTVINNVFSLKRWAFDYQKYYRLWLDKDDPAIYDLDAPINKQVIENIILVNELLPDARLTFWFDIDRSSHENFEWQLCPLSKKPLITLAPGYPGINRYISPDYPLVFPSTIR